MRVRSVGSRQAVALVRGKRPAGCAVLGVVRHEQGAGLQQPPSPADPHSVSDTYEGERAEDLFPSRLLRKVIKDPLGPGTPPAPGWFQASDGRWYPPTRDPNSVQPRAAQLSTLCPPTAPPPAAQPPAPHPSTLPGGTREGLGTRQEETHRRRGRAKVHPAYATSHPQDSEVSLTKTLAQSGYVKSDRPAVGSTVPRTGDAPQGGDVSDRWKTSGGDLFSRRQWPGGELSAPSEISQRVGSPSISGKSKPKGFVAVAVTVIVSAVVAVGVGVSGSKHSDTRAAAPASSKSSSTLASFVQRHASAVSTEIDADVSAGSAALADMLRQSQRIQQDQNTAANDQIETDDHQYASEGYEGESILSQFISQVADLSWPASMMTDVNALVTTMRQFRDDLSDAAAVSSSTPTATISAIQAQMGADAVNLNDAIRLVQADLR